MNISEGNSNVKIGIIDGPVDTNHPSLSGTKFQTIKNITGHCITCDNFASFHGTFITGILGGKRSSAVPGICPRCTYIVRPVFMEGLHANDFNFPSTSPAELANAIVETIDDGADIINMSVGLESNSITRYKCLEDAYNYALRKQVLLVISAGNQGKVGYIPLLNNNWVIPVTSCDQNGRFNGTSNFGPTIGTRGLMAPGVNIISCVPGGRYATMSGTSVAAAFVTGALSLLFSVFTKISTNEIRSSLFDSYSGNIHRGIIPRLLNVELAAKFLNDRSLQIANGK